MDINLSSFDGVAKECMYFAYDPAPTSHRDDKPSILGPSKSIIGVLVRIAVHLRVEMCVFRGRPSQWRELITLFPNGLTKNV